MRFEISVPMLIKYSAVTAGSPVGNNFLFVKSKSCLTGVRTLKFVKPRNLFEMFGESKTADEFREQVLYKKNKAFSTFLYGPVV